MASTAGSGRGTTPAATGLTVVSRSEVMAARRGRKAGESGRRGVTAEVTLEIAFARSRPGQARRVSTTAVVDVAILPRALLRQKESRCRLNREIAITENGVPVLLRPSEGREADISRRTAATSVVGLAKGQLGRRRPSRAVAVRVVVTTDSSAVPNRSATKATTTVVQSP